MAKRRKWVATLFACALFGLTAFTAVRWGQTSDARAVYQALAQQQYAYEAARHAEAEALAILDQDDTAASLQDAELRLVEAELRLTSIAIFLRRFGAESATRAQLLAPVLQSMDEERSQLHVALESIRSGSPLSGSGLQLTPDAFERVMVSLREHWGIRQRLWHGRPLTV
jgi:hypothetical protein